MSQVFPVQPRETSSAPPNRRLQPALCASWGRPLLAAERVVRLMTFRVLRGRRAVYLGAAPGPVPPVPRTGLPPRGCPRRWRYLVPRFGPRANLTEDSKGNEEPRGLCGLLFPSIPPNTRNDANEAKRGNYFGFTVRVKARSGAPPSSGWRCLACLPGKCRLQDHRSLTGATPDPHRTLTGDNFRPPATLLGGESRRVAGESPGIKKRLPGPPPPQPVLLAELSPASRRNP